MIFYKTSSFGNDFIEIDENDLPARGTDKCLLTRKICDAHRAVGADGVVFYRVGREAARADRPPSPRGAAIPLGDRPGKLRVDFQIFNRDGGEAELSGNGMAGLAAVLFQRRLASSPLILHAAIGRRHVELLARRGPVFQLNVEIGRPDFSNREFFPFLKDMRDYGVIDGLEFYPVSVGNPHAVVFCREQIDSKRLAALGKKLESHPMFPRRVNVEFVYFSDADSCRVFFYERGVGPTLASSTGSAAVFAVLRRLGKIRDHLTIDCDAEKIVVNWNRGIFVNNFTRLVCRGEYFH
jgi:diaminopimelate epimerase